MISVKQSPIRNSTGAIHTNCDTHHVCALFASKVIRITNSHLIFKLTQVNLRQKSKEQPVAVIFVVCRRRRRQLAQFGRSRHLGAQAR